MQTLHPAIDQLMRQDEWARWAAGLDSLTYDQAELEELVRLAEAWRAERLALRDARMTAAAAAAAARQQASSPGDDPTAAA